jgi:cation transport ATPase
MTKEEFAITEIRKWAWATTFEKEVCKVNGVKNAVVDKARKVLVVEYDEKIVARGEIQKTLTDTLARFLNKGFIIAAR